MTVKSICLHVPPLYEEGTAELRWSQAEGAEGYELDYWDEHFSAASLGLTWGDWEAEELSWQEREGQEMTWAEYGQIPARGILWQTIDCENKTWADIEEAVPNWRHVQQQRLRFLLFRGEGEPCRAPDQGLTWGNWDSMAHSWEELNEGGETWLDLELKPSVGRSWGQLEGSGAAWETVEERTWRELEFLEPLGLSWSSLEGHWQPWGELDGKELTWRDVERLPADRETHRSHTVDIPLYKKKTIFRLRAFGREGEFTPYVTTNLIDNLPRSLKKVRPPCLHMPELREGDPAGLSWGELYGAQGYCLERSTDSAAYQELYRGEGARKDHECPVMAEIRDAEAHYFHLDQIPIGTKTVRYRVKAFNTTDESQYFTGEEAKVIPLFTREGNLTMSTAVGGQYQVVLRAQHLSGRTGEVPLALEFDASVLRLEGVEKPAAGTGSSGPAVFQETGRSGGRITFRCVPTLSPDQLWSGVVARFSFSALKAGSARLTLQ